jgi:hypothetical protein
VNGKQKKRLIRIAILALFLLSGVLAADSDANQKIPPHILVDDGACPFECCKYQQWTVEKVTTLLDRPKGRRVVNTLSRGDVVTGLTGETISTPIAVQADRDIPDTPIKKGDTFYVLHYNGEGYWKVWFRGKLTYTPDYGRSNFPRPKVEWWVKIKDSHGNVGWSLSHGNFAHQDACE